VVCPELYQSVGVEREVEVWRVRCGTSIIITAVRT
jgi:hypothetical protein